MNKDKKKFLSLYEKYYQGELTMREYARQMNYTKPTIYKHMDRFGLKKRNGRLLDD